MAVRAGELGDDRKGGRVPAGVEGLLVGLDCLLILTQSPPHLSHGLVLLTTHPIVRLAFHLERGELLTNPRALICRGSGCRVAKLLHGFVKDARETIRRYDESPVSRSI